MREPPWRERIKSLKLEDVPVGCAARVRRLGEFF